MVDRRAARAEKRSRKAAILAEYAVRPSLMLDRNSERWLDIIESTASEDTESNSDMEWD
jgi:hypothetical protein